MQIRDATVADIPAILEIYNHAVLHTTAIWNEKTVDLANRMAWMAERQQMGYPILVAVDSEQRVLGYASFGDWRAFEGYRHTVEHSVYVHPQAQRGGVGKALMHELIGRAQPLHKHVMVAAIEAGNTASISLHRQLGFMQTGLMKEVGTKFGRWLDLVFMQLLLDTQEHPPT